MVVLFYPLSSETTQCLWKPSDIYGRFNLSLSVERIWFSCSILCLRKPPSVFGNHLISTEGLISRYLLREYGCPEKAIFYLRTPSVISGKVLTSLFSNL